MTGILQENRVITKIMVVDGYPLPGKLYGGADIHVDKLTQYISEIDDIELHVITLGNKNEQFKRGNVNVHTVNKVWFFTPFLLPFTVWSLRRTIKRIQPDVVHALGAFPYSTLAALLRKKYPTVITVFSLSAKELHFEKSIARILRKVLVSIPNETYVIPRIPHIIVQSHFIEGLIKERTKSKIHIVPEGIENEKIQQFQSHTLLSEAPDIFIATRLRKLKGLDILVKAVPMVMKSIPDIKVYIAGSGEEEYIGELNSLVKELDLEDHVKFLGFISDEEEKYRYYNACKIVVVPSRWDVGPFAALDGAVLGKPVIATEECNASVVEDGKTGFVFKSEDVEGLVDKITKLLTDDKLRGEMGKRAKEKAREYDWTKIAKRTFEIYQEVIADFHNRKRE